MMPSVSPRSPSCRSSFSTISRIGIVPPKRRPASPNLVTNLALPKCGAADQPFRRLIAYAAAKLSSVGAAVYLDAGHAGWLGWDNNRKKAVEIYQDILARAGGNHTIRGFFTNVSNYNVVQGDDSKKLEPSTPTPDELTYVAKLSQRQSAAVMRSRRRQLGRIETRE
jgi:cellulase/cellobiase CelA1